MFCTPFCYLIPPKTPVLDRRKTCGPGEKSEFRDRSTELLPQKWSVWPPKVVSLTPQSDQFDPWKWSLWGKNWLWKFENLPSKIWKQALKIAKNKSKMKIFKVMVGVKKRWNPKMAAFRTSETPFPIIFPEFSGGKPDRKFFPKI